MRSIISWFIKNPVAANLMMVAMFVVGVIGYFSLEREFIPQPTLNGITVSVTWQGASPRDVEEQLLVRIEEAVDGLDGIDFVESNAREGSGNVNITTKLQADYEKLLDEVKTRVDTIRNLPPDAFRPEVTRWDAEVDMMFMALYGDLDRLALQRAANDLRLKITEQQGLQLTRQISKVAEQVTIEISEEALRRYNLTFSQVGQAISASSVNLSAGTVETTGGNLQLRARSLANSASDFENIIVRQTSAGGTIRVGDVATVIDRFENDKFAATYKGQPAAVFQVSSPDVMNVTNAGKALRQFEKDINETLPSELTFDIWFDGSTMFDSRMSLIGSNALSGMVLVLVILVLFLRPSVAMWVTVGIAAAFMGAIAVAPYLGITLNMISLFAFLLVIGIVVDDAIVVGESIHFHNENGIVGEQGAIAGANMVVKPVFFAVITTILMFVPFMLISGPLRVISEQISLVVIAVLVFSLIEAFFILPSHLRHLRQIEEEKLGPLLRFQNRIANALIHFAKTFFRPLVATLMQFRYITVSVFIGLFVMAIALLQAGIAPKAFFPEVEGDIISFTARFPEGTTFERREQVRAQVDQGIDLLNTNSEQDFGIEGEVITNYGTVTNRRSVDGFLGLLTGNKRRNTSTQDIADKLEEYVGPIPDAFRVTFGTTEGPPTNGRGVNYGVASADPDALELAILDLKSELDSFSSVRRTFDSLESSAKEFQFTLKPGAETLGINLASVTRQVREAFFGLEVQRLPRNGEDVRVMLRYPEAARESIESLKNLRIRGANGVEVPLYSVADVSFNDGISQIRRRDRKRMEFVGARVQGEKDAVANLRKEMNDVVIPEWEKRHPRVTRILIGDDDAQRTLLRELTLSTFAIFFMMYGLLAIAFKSYAQPLLIMIAIPFALVGMIFGNMVTDVPFGMMSIFGFFAASGVAVNDNLVLIDYVNRLRDRGVGAYQAMLDASVSRFRPILLTSVTTFIGITPILFETSTQAEFLKPMVVALAYGVLFDFFLTLMLVPAMYCIGVDITRFFRGLWRGEKQPGLGSTYDPNVALALETMEADDLMSDSHTSGTTPQPAE